MRLTQQLKKILKIYIKHYTLRFYSILNKSFLSANGHLQEQFAEYFSTQDFQDRLEQLEKNLDLESSRTLRKIISRLQECYAKKFFYSYHLSQEERDRLTYVKTCFQYQIIKIPKTTGAIWDYNGYKLPKNQFEIGIFMDHHGIKQFQNLEKIRSKNIIDVGAFIGDSAIILEQYTDRNIYAFEADKNNFSLLQQTIQMNNLQKTIPISQALGSTTETRNFYPNEIGSSFIYQSETKQCEIIKIITLDDYVEKHDLEIGLIKVDIEGFEMEFLKGALQTIKSQKPSMIISIYHTIDDFFDIKTFIEDLNLGYKFKIFKPIDQYVAIDTCLLCEV